MVTRPGHEATPLAPRPGALAAWLIERPSMLQNSRHTVDHPRPQHHRAPSQTSLGRHHNGDGDGDVLFGRSRGYVGVKAQGGTHLARTQAAVLPNAAISPPMPPVPSDLTRNRYPFSP